MNDFVFVLATVAFFVLGLRKAKVTSHIMLGNLLLIVIAILLCGYLFYALVKPENF